MRHKLNLALWLALAFLALVAYGAWAFRSQNQRISELVGRLSAVERERLNLYETRYTPPAVDTAKADEGVPPMDVVGSWAYEMALAGVRVPDEEIQLQRRMRAEAGL